MGAPAATPATPRGVGIYARTLRRSTYGTPEQMARRARDHRLSLVPLLAVWQDERGLLTPNDGALGDYAAALASEGIAPWVWGYPQAGGEAEFVEALVSRARNAGARGVILDPEVSYKNRPRAMQQLVRLTREAIGDSLGLGFTTFGQPAIHRTFPWHNAGGVGWGSPQLYRAPPERAVRALEDWEALGWSELVPSIPTFGDGSAPRALRELVDTLAARPSVRGLLFWSWNSADSRDLAAIARAADLLTERTRVSARAAAPADPTPPFAPTST